MFFSSESSIIVNVFLEILMAITMITASILALFGLQKNNVSAETRAVAFLGHGAISCAIFIYWYLTSQQSMLLNHLVLLLTAPVTAIVAGIFLVYNPNQEPTYTCVTHYDECGNVAYRVSTGERCGDCGAAAHHDPC